MIPLHVFEHRKSEMLFKIWNICGPGAKFNIFFSLLPNICFCLIAPLQHFFFVRFHLYASVYWWFCLRIASWSFHFFRFLPSSSSSFSSSSFQCREWHHKNNDFCVWFTSVLTLIIKKMRRQSVNRYSRNKYKCDEHALLDDFEWALHGTDTGVKSIGSEIKQVLRNRTIFQSV